jgi:hypothetical protein
MSNSKDINNTQHCQLCNHQLFEIQTGTKCGLTNMRPDFNTSCGKASFSRKLEKMLIKRHLEYKELYSSRIAIHLKSGLYIGIGLAIIIGSYWFAVKLDDAGWISTIPFITAGGGFLQMLISIRPSVAHQQKLTVAEERIQELNSILAAYHLSYTFENGILSISDKLPYSLR